MKEEMRSALITGAGGNIGRACAIELTTHGFNIVINGSSDRKACERVAKEVRSAGSNAIVAMADIGDKSAVAGRIDAALEPFGSIDVLVNNAVIRPSTSFLEMSDDDLAAVTNVNSYAAVWLARAFLPNDLHPLNCTHGTVIFVLPAEIPSKAPSGVAMSPCRHVAMSKPANWGVIKTLSREFGPQGITANLISLGTFPDQDMDISKSVAMQVIRKKVPVTRLGNHEDISAMVGLLCSERGEFINGQLLQINGGVVG